MMKIARSNIVMKLDNDLTATYNSEIVQRVKDFSDRVEHDLRNNLPQIIQIDEEVKAMSDELQHKYNIGESV
jgi:hypothetical protein